MDAVVSVLRYAMGMPHHRLAQWQKWAGVPFAASTQFERAEAMANAVLPVFRHMETLLQWWPRHTADGVAALPAEQLAVLICNGLPLRAGMAEAWRRVS